MYEAHPTNDAREAHFQQPCVQQGTVESHIAGTRIERAANPRGQIVDVPSACAVSVRGGVVGREGHQRKTFTAWNVMILSPSQIRLVQRFGKVLMLLNSFTA